ncbi:MAG: twin-arginine translocase TatA/TatE family subunit [Acidobacteriota bacterium]|nr:twin-arginine translocase TatA/TatE family subunit [Acidobacteriota bacterium]MDE3171252.1 twin-arginine translocase TatA/TatE family subunit [Acidobacteriota bacterium]
MWDSPIHLLIVAIVVLVLFGGRKIPEVMKGLGQGVREFKDGMRGESAQPQPPANPVQQAVQQAPQATAPPAPIAAEQKK